MFVQPWHIHTHIHTHICMQVHTLTHTKATKTTNTTFLPLFCMLSKKWKIFFGLQINYEYTLYKFVFSNSAFKNSIVPYILVKQCDIACTAYNLYVTSLCSQYILLFNSRTKVYSDVFILSLLWRAADSTTSVSNSLPVNVRSYYLQSEDFKSILTVL